MLLSRGICAVRVPGKGPVSIINNVFFQRVMKDGAGGLVSTGSKFPESLNLKMGQPAISYFAVHPRNVICPTQKIILHRNKYLETNRIHDPK